jgi:hypothetical protein
METPFAQNKNKKIISQGKQTIFRVTSRTQVNLIRIADNKANMIMGINAIIISVLMGIISSRMIHTPETIQGNLLLTIPVILIILTALLTAYFAISAAKPKLLKLGKSNPVAGEKKSLLFFENIWELSAEDYIEQMETLLDSSKDMYQHMIIDIHNQSKVLHRKYELLSKAYTVFIFGFIISILTFVFLWLLQ